MLGLTAAEIAKLAFNGVIQAGAGALSVVSAKKLWQKIRSKFQGNRIAIEALNDAESQRSPEILEEKVVPLLEEAMGKEPQFAQEIQMIAVQINHEIEANTADEIQMNAKAYNQSTVKQVGKIQADNVSF
ncbi:MAG: hypothetical protein QNJ54_37065 [Prochloraceae cyanobacterium]|nr:hypothetical protein [Prochloraceae cyanobacterium]